MKEPKTSYEIDGDDVLQITEYGPEDEFLLAEGFEYPNYTQIPNQILGTWKDGIFVVGQMSDMTEVELKVALALCRITFGFHRNAASASLSWLEKATGLSRQGVLNGIERLTKRGLFIKDKSEDGRNLWRKVQGGSQQNRLGVVNSVDHTSQQNRPNKESIKKERKKVPAISSRPPADQDPAGQEDLKELEYVDIDDMEEVSRPKWSIPETVQQEAFLNVCGARWFQPKQKSKVKALLRAFDAGDVLGDRVYEECARSLEDIPDLNNRNLPPMPSSWLKWRSEHAKEHRWSVDGFIKSLLNRDALMQHCRYHMKGKATGKVEGDVYIIEIPEGGPR